MKLHQLLYEVKSEINKGNLDKEIGNLTADSRKVDKGSLYIALPGTKTDGQNFISEVSEKGVAAVLCSSEWLQSQESLPENVAFIGVKDRRKAFAQISANFYDNPTYRLKLIGVTGTNGKTTTTHLIESILQLDGARTGLMGTLYYRYGTVQKESKFTTPMADQLQLMFKEMVDNNVDTLIMEVSSHALEQYRVGACKYSVAVFTNITQDHLDYHPTFEDYKEAKAILFSEQLKNDGCAVINMDDPSYEFFKNKSAAKVITYGLNEKADIYATDINLKMDGTTFTVHLPSGPLKLELNLVGKFNIYNTLAAIGTAYAMEIAPEIMKKALEATKGIAGRIEIVTPKGHPYTVVVDYAHTPDSLENILSTCREFTEQRLITVFGCGGDRDKTKRPLMGEIARRISDISVVTSDNPRTEDPMAIIDDIMRGIEEKEAVFVEPDRRNAIQKAIELAREGDTVVIAGKGHEDYQIFKDRTVHFDDRETAREFVALKVSS